MKETSKFYIWVMLQDILLWPKHRKVIFLLPTTAPLLQPIDQEVTSTFEAPYFQNTFAKLIQMNSGENKPMWRNFGNISTSNTPQTSQLKTGLKCVNSCMNGVWKKLLFHFVRDFWGSERRKEMKTLQQKCVEMWSHIKQGCHMKS